MIRCYPILQLLVNHYYKLTMEHRLVRSQDIELLKEPNLGGNIVSPSPISFFKPVHVTLSAIFHLLIIVILDLLIWHIEREYHKAEFQKVSQDGCILQPISQFDSGRRRIRCTNQRYETGLLICSGYFFFSLEKTQGSIPSDNLLSNRSYREYSESPNSAKSFTTNCSLHVHTSIGCFRFGSWVCYSAKIIIQISLSAIILHFIFEHLRTSFILMFYQTYIEAALINTFLIAGLYCAFTLTIER